MNQFEIKAAIKAAGTSPAAIARYLEVSSTSVCRVINGSMRSARIERELQKITGKPIAPPARKPGRPKTTWNGRLSAARLAA